MNMLKPMRESNLRLSIFVDADNVPASQARAILDLAEQHGMVELIRAYGNVRNLPGWDTTSGFHLVHSGSGKNATDMLICLDAMERALSGQCDAVLLVSSDQDFTHLAMRLRGYGLSVIGAGAAKTSERFRAACSEFHVLPCDKSFSAVASQPVPETPASAAQDLPSNLDQKIRDMIRSNCKDKTGYEIALLSANMHRVHGMRISERAEKTWRAYLAKRPALYDLDPKGPHAKVRYRPGGFVSTHDD